MQKLTRTQKYAGLREQLANDKEPNISSNDLSSYQNRLDTVQETLNPNLTNEYEDIFTPEPVSVDTFASELDSIFDEVVQPKVDVQQPTVEEEVVEPIVETQTSDFAQSSSYFDSFMNTNQDNTVKTDYNSYFENDTKEDKYNIDNIFNSLFDDVKDVTEDTITKNERDTYLNTEDVNSFTNDINIQPIAETIANEAIEAKPTSLEAAVNVQDEVKETADDMYPWTDITEEPLDAELETQTVTNEVADEEFTNTVSMEVSKIMDEISYTPPVVNEPIKPLVEPTPIVEKNEDVVEIKNIAEIDHEPIRDTLSSTIPFIVASSDEDEIEDEEEESPNTILNIILIVLIVALVAILGLIVFYILKTKGIF